MNTKTILFAVALLIGTTLFAQDQNFSIEGKVQNFKKGDKIHLIKQSNSGRSIDTIICLKNGRLSYSAYIAEPMNALLVCIPDGKSVKEAPMSTARPFYIYPDNKLSIEGDMLVPFNTKISGGIYSDARYTKFFSELEVIEGELTQLHKKMDQVKAEKGIKEEFLALNDSAFATQKKSYELMGEFIQSNPDDEFSAFLLTNIRGSYGSKNQERLYNLLSAKVKNTTSAKEVAKSINVQKTWSSAKEKLKVGLKAADFTLTELNGTKMSLSDFRGKYVLIDFWGSWCGPCREANKQMVELYNSYKNEANFELISLALDPDEKAWKDAIIKDGLLWKQFNMSEEKDPMKAVNTIYGIFVYPTQVLISPEGVIIAVQLGTPFKEDPIIDKLKSIYPRK